MRGVLDTLARVGRRLFAPAATRDYPEAPPDLAPRTRGRLVLTRDPDGQERCVACKLCAAACPVDCIAIEQAVLPDGRWHPERFTVNLGRCIFCGYCEEACPTAAIQLVPDVELAEWHRDAMVWEKEHLTIAGEGKVPGYTYWAVAGVAIAGKDIGEAETEEPPIDLKSLRP